MIKFIVHDTVNDVALIETTFGYNVRYGLRVTKHESFELALADFQNCLSHALASKGHIDE